MAVASADVCTPRTVGPYGIVCEIGRGAMGVVYRAVRAGGGPEVALKVPFVERSDHFRCIRREIHALSRLHHPGVVRIVEEGMERGVPWYAMELLEARSLHELLGISGERIDPTEPVCPFEHAVAAPVRGMVRSQRPIRGDLRRALTLMYRLARVLAYVHGRGVVHRDLKPHNVLVRPDDRPILVDFGLMGSFRAQSARETLEVGGMMMGTAVYAAPEQAAGELVDARADLYSFGVMLYEIVAGIPPFDGLSVRDVLMMHRSLMPTPPSRIVDGIPPLLETLILRLLEKRPADRLGYAEDVAALLVEAGAESDRDGEVETAAAYLYRPEIIGREETLASLRAHLPKVREGAGAFFCLGGESGIGKTSVAAAFARDATLGRFRVVIGESDPVGGQPLHPLRPLLRELADLCRTDPEIFEAAVAPRLQVLRELDPAFAAFADDALPRIPAEIISRRLFDDLATTIAELARRCPLLLIIDDLQWADEVTLRFLSTLDEAFFDGAPLLVLATYRAEEVGPDLRALLAKPAVAKVSLGRLDEGSVGDIVRSMLAAPDVPPSFLQFLARQSEGNPFFVAEYLRSAVAERLLFREKGRWLVHREDETYATVGLPGTIRDLVGYRLDRLSAIAQRFAEAASVLGREVPEDLLLATCSETELEAFEAISELLERHVFDIIEDSEGVRFAHDKLREGAYARLTPDRRRILHGRAAAGIEALCTNEELLRRHAAELAHHYDVAGDDPKAIRYSVVASESALSTGACRESVELMNRVLILDERSPVSTSTAERALHHAHWHRVLSHAHFGLGDVATSIEEARRSLWEVGIDLPRTPAAWRRRLVFEALKQIVHLVLPRRWLRAREKRQPALHEIAQSARQFSEASYFATEFEQTLVTGLLCLNAAERLPASAGVGRGYASLAVVVAGALGLHALAERYLEEGRRLAAEANDLDSIAYVGFASIWYYTNTCNWQLCARYAEDAVGIARMTGDHQLTEYCQTMYCTFEYYIGRLESSVRTCVAIRESAHKRANRQHETWGYSGAARALTPLGRLEEALDALNVSLRLIEGQNDSLTELLIRSKTPDPLLHLGRLDEALHAADLAYGLALQQKVMLWEAWRGFTAPAEVYLELWPRVCHDLREVEHFRRRLDVILSRLRSVARRMPLVRPVTLRLAGMAECVKGNVHRGEKLLRKSIAEATRLGLPLDEGIGNYELVRRCRLDAPEKAQRWDRARTIFQSIGGELYLRKMMNC